MIRRKPPLARLPTPDELAACPELAILDSIEAVIDLAILALVAAQPELQPTDDGLDAATTSTAKDADRVITTAQALAVAITRYRRRVTPPRHCNAERVNDFETVAITV
ncbi:MAG: hypothetical protein HY744_03615 [Deltaproteobacteria bacterium]|nr:hypothetical protein [Deltaproteobacteria bacterium]